MPNTNDNIANANISEQDALGETGAPQVQPALAQFEVGSYVTFGRYPQNNGDTPEPIEWLVLDKDEISALLLAKYGLDCQPYHHKLAEVSWEDCDLRKWLNSDFLHKAFTDEEISRIEDCKMWTGDWCSTGICFNDWEENKRFTSDKVFCLSVREADRNFNRKYFLFDQDRLCRPTAYAVSRGAYRHDYNGCCRYWLRNPVDGIRNAARVNAVGHICFKHWLSSMMAVRSALRVKLQ